MPTFGENLVSIRKQKGIAQKELAKMIGVSPTQLNYWEKDRRQPKVEEINLLAEKLGVPVAYLMDWEGLAKEVATEEIFESFISSLGYSTRHEEDVVTWHEEDVVDSEGTVIGISQVADDVNFYTYLTGKGVSLVFNQDEFETFRKEIENIVHYAVSQRKK